MPYNPFDVPIGDAVTAADLQVLIAREVKEGYYVEFKSAKPDNKKIGHSIASLGNTFGGWYVVGIDADKTQNVATRVCGFSAADWPDPIATVRDIVKTHISPRPLFFPQVIKLDESGDRLALVVYVPGEQDTPFVTSDGRIYIRVQDSSDPVPANNRYDLERIEARGRESRDAFAHFCRDTRSFSNADADLGWLHIYIAPYPPGLIERLDLATEQGLTQVLELSKATLPATIGNTTLFSGNLPFTAGQLATRSVLLRQVAMTRVGRPSLTVELYQGGSAKLHIPLWQTVNPIFTQVEGDGPGEFASAEVGTLLRKYRAQVDGDPDESLHLLKFFDVAQLWINLILLLNYYEAWLGDDMERVELKVALALDGVWRHCAFLDAEVWAEHVQTYGLPVILDSHVRDPWLAGEAFFLEARRDRQLWLEFLTHVTRLIGLSETVFVQGIGTVLERASRTR